MHKVKLPCFQSAEGYMSALYSTTVMERLRKFRVHFLSDQKSDIGMMNEFAFGSLLTNKDVNGLFLQLTCVCVTLDVMASVHWGLLMIVIYFD